MPLLLLLPLCHLLREMKPTWSRSPLSGTPGSLSKLWSVAFVKVAQQETFGTGAGLVNLQTLVKGGCKADDQDMIRVFALSPEQGRTDPSFKQSMQSMQSTKLSCTPSCRSAHSPPQAPVDCGHAACPPSFLSCPGPPAPVHTLLLIWAATVSERRKESTSHQTTKNQTTVLIYSGRQAQDGT